MSPKSARRDRRRPRAVTSILVINPNSSVVVTEALDRALEPLRHDDGPAIETMTIPEGPPGIETQAQVYAASAHVTGKELHRLREIQDRQVAAPSGYDSQQPASSTRIRWRGKWHRTGNPSAVASRVEFQARRLSGVTPSVVSAVEETRNVCASCESHS